MRRIALALVAVAWTTLALGDGINNPQTNASNLISGTVAAARGGAGTISGALKGNGSGVTSQAACADLSNGSGACAQTYTATTWTPAFIGSTTPGIGQTYSIQSGSYEVIGRQVTARFYVAATSLGTAAGSLQISGLPVTSANTANDLGTCSISYYSTTGLAALNYGLSGIINPSSNLVTIYENGNTQASQLTVAQAGSTVAVAGVCSYHN